MFNFGAHGFNVKSVASKLNITRSRRMQDFNHILYIMFLYVFSQFTTLLEGDLYYNH